MISKGDIVGLAKLARLEMSETEVTSLQKDVTSILEYVGQVTAVSGDADAKLAGKAPMHRNILREDIPRAAESQLAGKEELIRAQFPTREGDYNLVRKIIQKDE